MLRFPTKSTLYFSPSFILYLIASKRKGGLSMHLNASWKGEIQPVLPSDNLRIHLIWLISAGILIILKATLAEILLSTYPVFEWRFQYSARNQSLIVFREGLPLTLFLWPWDRAIPCCFSLGKALGLRAEGLVSGSCSLKTKIARVFLGAPFSDSADAHTFCVTLELVSTWVLRQLKSSPWLWHFCLSWLNSGILFLLSIPRSFEAQLPFSITHQCDISSWRVQNKVLFCFSRVRSF